MTPDQFVRGVPGFGRLSHAERIRLFAWYCHFHLQQQIFTAADIKHCYDETDIAPPTSINSFLNQLTKARPPLAIRANGGFKLERKLREQLDLKYGARPTTIHVDKLLSGLPNQIGNLTERAYLDEALTCFRHEAFRAAIVMTWNLAYDHLCQLVLSNHLSVFNTQLPKVFPKADIQVITKRDDFNELKEHQVLQVCKSANIISSAVYKIAKDKLDKRNIAAHPSGVRIFQPTAEEYIKDLVENVVLKL